MTIPIHIERVRNSRASELDFNTVALGNNFTDHMLVCNYENGEWQDVTIQPTAPIPTHPAAMALHYGQAIFEGMKATVNEKTKQPLLFRPEQNAQRFNRSAARMGMPNLPENIFLEGIKALVDLDRNWIPPEQGSALYLRPFMYADEPFIGMRAATSFKFVVIASPARPLFSKRINLWAEQHYIRAAQGGTGEAKAAGNYAAAVLPTEKAKSKGYDQVLWLDANEHRYIQEVGTMNIFFHIDNHIITPATDGSILKGITRDSVITLLKDFGHTVEERPITIDEIETYDKEGRLKEAFGTGTAVSVTFINSIANADNKVQLPEDNPIANRVLNHLNDLKSGLLEDKHGWIVTI